MCSMHETGFAMNIENLRLIRNVYVALTVQRNNSHCYDTQNAFVAV